MKIDAQGSAAGQHFRVRVHGAAGVDYDRAPVTFGVPFADGVLEAGTPIRLRDATGKVLPVQTRCLATWQPDRRFVKWLLADTSVALGDAGASPVRELTVEWPGDAEPAPERERVRIERRDDALLVDTGVLRLRLPRAGTTVHPSRGGGFLESCQVRGAEGWRDLLDGDRRPHLYMVDQHGNRYDSCGPGSVPVVELEEEGALRCCVRIAGHLTSADGVRFCPYIVRLHCFAGSDELRIHHTFVFDQEPDAVQLAAIGLHLPLGLGHDLRGAVGGDSTAPGEPPPGHVVEAGGALQLLQEDDRHYRVLSGDRTVATGRRSSGWAGLSGSAGSAVAVVRDLWQEYPKGLAVATGGGGAGIDIGIWPRQHAQPLAFTTPYREPALRFDGYRQAGDVPRPLRDEAEVARLLAENPTAPLNLKSFNIRSVEDARWVEQVIERLAPDRVRTYNDTGTEDGTGAAKTTEIHLKLGPGVIDDAAAARFAATVNEPLTAMVEPRHLAASGAIGHFHHAGDARFAAADGDLDDYFPLITTDPVEPSRRYGMMRYGNAVCVHSSAVGWVYLLHRDRAPEKALRSVGPYHNEANDQIMAVWCHAARTGNREHLLLAQRYSRAVADTGFVHADPRRPERVGLMHYHNGHVWSGGMSPSHSLVSGLLTDYYLTGNRRLLEVAREVADRIVRTQEPAGILSCRGGGLHREYAGPLSVLLELYQATWEQRYGALAERSLAWLLRTVTVPGRFPNTLATGGEQGDEALVRAPCLPEVAWGNKYYLFEPALRLFPSPALREFVLAEADYWAWQSPRDLLNYACSTVCCAYDLSGREEYAAYARNLIDTLFHDFVESMRAGEQMDFAAMRFSGYVPRLMRIVASAMERDPEGFAGAVQRWQERRAELPDRPEEERLDSGGVTSLGRLDVTPVPALPHPAPAGSTAATTPSTPPAAAKR